MTNFTLLIGNMSTENNIDQVYFKECISAVSHARKTKTWQCEKALIGQYVKIQLEGKGLLSLCEVQIHGKPPGKFRK